MLFPFLVHMNRETFNDLPWELQRTIAEFHPNLPLLHYQVRDTLRAHLSTRYCTRCGKCLPKWNKIFRCLCRHHHLQYKYHVSERTWRSYRRPFHIFQTPSVSMSEFRDVWSENPESTDVMIASNQQEYVYSFRKLLHQELLLVWLTFLRYDDNMERIVARLIHKRLNTHTCMKSFMDGFVNPSYFHPVEDMIECVTAFDTRRTQNKHVYSANPYPYNKIKKKTSLLSWDDYVYANEIS